MAIYLKEEVGFEVKKPTKTIVKKTVKKDTKKK